MVQLFVAAACLRPGEGKVWCLAQGYIGGLKHLSCYQDTPSAAEGHCSSQPWSTTDWAVATLRFEFHHWRGTKVLIFSFTVTTPKEPVQKHYLREFSFCSLSFLKTGRIREVGEIESQWQMCSSGPVIASSDKWTSGLCNLCFGPQTAVLAHIKGRRGWASTHPPMNNDQGPMRSQHTVWRLHKSDYAAIFQSAAAAWRIMQRKTGASLSCCNLSLDPACSPACMDFPSAKDASARFPLLNVQQQNQNTTYFRVISFPAATRATPCQTMNVVLLFSFSHYVCELQKWF